MKSTVAVACQRGEALPGEALLTVLSPLIHCQHVGVGRASEHQLPHSEVPQRPQATAFVRAGEPLGALDTFVRHLPLFFCFLAGVVVERNHRHLAVSLGCSNQLRSLLSSCSFFLASQHSTYVAFIAPYWRIAVEVLFWTE